MREILFRGKDILTGEWLYGDLIQSANEEDAKFIVPFTETNTRGIIPETIGQFTGCCDKNGTKIFEGDIVLKRTHNGKKAFAVTFNDGMFHCGYGGGSSTPIHPYALADRQIEVVGNIYDEEFKE